MILILFFTGNKCTAPGYTYDSSVGVCYRFYINNPADLVPISSIVARCKGDGGRILLADNLQKLQFARQLLGKYNSPLN